jgi:hypothetical protein
MLFSAWFGHLHRPTRDLDLLGLGDSSPERLVAAFRALCKLKVEDDGLLFCAETITVEPIREDQEYGGERLKLEVRLGQARIGLQVDVGFGDAITPAAEVIEYPTLLGTERPRLSAYPQETMVAEKLEAMVKLGIANTRMKDFFDVAILARTSGFSGPVLRDAIAATFQRRRTAIPTELPIALSGLFASDVVKSAQWVAFLERNGLEDGGGGLNQVVSELAAFLSPPMIALAKREAFDARWEAGGPWRPFG